MSAYIIGWFRRYFSDPQAILLLVFLVSSFILLLTMGNILKPLFAAIILAYLLEGLVQKIRTLNVSRLVAVNIVYLLFIVFCFFLFLGILPIISQQLSQFFQDVPAMINNGQKLLMKLPNQYPEFFPKEVINEITNTAKRGMTELGQNILSISAASIPAIINILVYLILVPLMVFFLLKDKDIILKWLRMFLPTERLLLTKIWHEMDNQMGNYIRGKFNEIIVVGIVAFALFKFMGLDYASLLAITVGLSVLIPYIGAAIVTLPVALVAYFQWGLDSHFVWVMISYGILQFIDGNILVPILFSDAVNLHPIAIIVAILVFGGFWGFWGVFFAIPLAILVKALINIWPTSTDTIPDTSAH